MLKLYREICLLKAHHVNLLKLYPVFCESNKMWRIQERVSCLTLHIL